jgi:hypothetical protein
MGDAFSATICVGKGVPCSCGRRALAVEKLQIDLRSLGDALNLLFGSLFADNMPESALPDFRWGAGPPRH